MRGSAGTRPTTVGRPCGSRAVVTTPAGLCRRTYARRRSAAGVHTRRGGRDHPQAVKKAAAWDAAALLVFVVVGVVTHDASATAFVRDLACILGGWFAVAIVLRLYVRGGRWRLAATWLV